MFASIVVAFTIYHSTESLVLYLLLVAEMDYFQNCFYQRFHHPYSCIPIFFEGVFAFVRFDISNTNLDQGTQQEIFLNNPY
jgi:hypothetical protein